ncbi:flagellar filament capping protein FliD [Rhodospirillaceae bacterium SYSU D60014]|uniref:flagellar filament capping protein FliD n=1 Tax=Virgifigura deserti TaxID=2268457 RepID=UPI0013C438F8
MADGINFSNLTVDSSGRVRFSGIGSGIDYQAAIDGIIAARRIPVDTLEDRITANQDKITAYKDLQLLLSALKDSLNTLRGAVTFGGAGNVFEAKQAFASVSRSDGTTPSDAANLIGVTVTNAADTGAHTIEVLRTATAHKIGSGAFTSQTDNIGVARGGASGSISGSFNINGVTIDVMGTDSLQDLRDRINNANTGDNATGVSASIVSAGTNQNYLVLTADEAGTAITLDNETGGVLSDLGISDDGGTTLLNELQAPQTAQFYADGLLDASKYASIGVASDTAALSGYTSVAGGPHSFEIRDASGALLKTVSYSDTDTLQTLAANITDAGAGITATVVESDGQYRLNIVKDDGGAITLANDSSSLLSDLGVAKQPLLIERSTNTIDDLFDGVTLNLFQAEPGTTIRIEVEQDLSAVKTAVASFVEAYNTVKAYINAQSQPSTSTDETDEEATSVLFGSNVVAGVEAGLSRILGGGTPGVDPDYSVLAQIGITFVDNNAVADPLLADTLEIDEAALDEALLNDPDAVRQLFGFEMTSSDSRVTLLGFSGETTYNRDGYTLNVTHDGTKITSANINGVPGSVTIEGNVLKATDATGAAGLTLFYSGTGDASIELDYTVGIGARMFHEIDSFIDSQTGSVQSEIDGLTDQNTVSQERIGAMLERLDYQRAQLTSRFIAMETSLATMNRILDSIKQTVDAWYAES